MNERSSDKELIIVFFQPIGYYEKSIGGSMVGVLIEFDFKYSHFHTSR